MFTVRRTVVTLAASVAIAPILAASAPAQVVPAPLAAPLTTAQPMPSPTPAVVETPASDQLAAPEAAPAVEQTSDAAPSPEQSAAIECIAKVVRHEAANQPRKGQLAVAQLIMNRVKVGSRFGHSPCAVVNQPGQFFNTDSYNPDRKSPAWSNAVAVSRDAVEHVSPAVTPGALFYHAAYQAPPRFFRSRQRVAVLGDHVFYR